MSVALTIIIFRQFQVAQMIACCSLASLTPMTASKPSVCSEGRREEHTLCLH